MVHKDSLLGDFPNKSTSFDNLEEILMSFKKRNFQDKNIHEKNNIVNLKLFEKIKEAEAPVFLMGAVVEYIATINKEKILENYTFLSFELWLNQFSELSTEENYKIRGKIAGKWIPRDNYQSYFPIGMGKSYSGTHFVTAHSSPDLDTTVASFWGWVDAFAARVGNGLHLWNVPGGPPPGQVEVKILFQDIEILQGFLAVKI